MNRPIRQFIVDIGQPGGLGLHLDHQVRGPVTIEVPRDKPGVLVIHQSTSSPKTRCTASCTSFAVGGGSGAAEELDMLTAITDAAEVGIGFSLTRFGSDPQATRAAVVIANHNFLHNNL